MSSDTQSLDYFRAEIEAHFGKEAVEPMLAQAIADGKAMHPEGKFRKAYVYVALRRRMRERGVVFVAGRMPINGTSGTFSAEIRSLTAHGAVAVSRFWSALRVGRGTKSTNSTSI